MEKPIKDSFILHIGMLQYLPDNKITEEHILEMADTMRSFWSPNDICNTILMNSDYDKRIVQNQKLIPLNNDGFGNIFMLAENGDVYFWDHEYGWNPDTEVCGIRTNTISISDYLEYNSIVEDCTNEEILESFITDHNISAWFE